MLGDVDHSMIASELAYAPTQSDRTHMTPHQAVEADRAAMFYQALEFSKQGSSLPRTDTKVNAWNKQRAGNAVHILNNMNVHKASRDAVAFIERNPSTKNGKENLRIAFRGTHIAPDFWTDYQLARNAPSIARLDQARKFTNAVKKELPHISAARTQFNGHSLGGFVAEGVANDHPGSQALSFEPGAPVIRNGQSKANAFGPLKQNAKLPIRIRREGSPISAAANELNPRGITINSPQISRNPVTNHELDGAMPWLQIEPKDERERKSLVTAYENTLRRQREKYTRDMAELRRQQIRERRNHPETNFREKHQQQIANVNDAFRAQGNQAQQSLNVAKTLSDRRWLLMPDNPRNMRFQSRGAKMGDTKLPKYNPQVGAVLERNLLAMPIDYGVDTSPKEKRAFDGIKTPPRDATAKKSSFSWIPPKMTYGRYGGNGSIDRGGMNKEAKSFVDRYNLGKETRAPPNKAARVFLESYKRGVSGIGERLDYKGRLVPTTGKARNPKGKGFSFSQTKKSSSFAPYGRSNGKGSISRGPLNKGAKSFVDRYNSASKKKKSAPKRKSSSFNWNRYDNLVSKARTNPSFFNKYETRSATAPKGRRASIRSSSSSKSSSKSSSARRRARAPKGRSASIRSSSSSKSSSKSSSTRRARAPKGRSASIRSSSSSKSSSKSSSTRSRRRRARAPKGRKASIRSSTSTKSSSRSRKQSRR